MTINASDFVVVESYIWRKERKEDYYMYAYGASQGLQNKPEEKNNAH